MTENDIWLITIGVSIVIGFASFALVSLGLGKIIDTKMRKAMKKSYEETAERKG